MTYKTYQHKILQIKRRDIYKRNYKLRVDSSPAVEVADIAPYNVSPKAGRWRSYVFLEREVVQ